MDVVSVSHFKIDIYNEIELIRTSPDVLSY